jgi:hypothetical protein
MMEVSGTVSYSQNTHKIHYHGLHTAVAAKRMTSCKGKRLFSIKQKNQLLWE